MNILFICKYNRFRSRTAEAAFKKLNKNKAIKASSAGIIQGWYPLDQVQVKIAKELGLDIDGKPQALSTKLLREQNKVVIVANNVPVSLFERIMVADKTPLNFKEGKNLLLWNIPDEENDNEENIRKIVKSIIVKVNGLVDELKEER